MCQWLCFKIGSAVYPKGEFLANWIYDASAAQNFRIRQVTDELRRKFWACSVREASNFIQTRSRWRFNAPYALAILTPCTPSALAFSEQLRLRFLLRDVSQRVDAVMPDREVQSVQPVVWTHDNEGRSIGQRHSCGAQQVLRRSASP
jgi:hypothetical protein